MKRAGLLGVVLSWVRTAGINSVLRRTVKKPVMDTRTESLDLLKFQAMLPLNSICGCLCFIQFVKSNNLKNRGKMG